MNIQDGLYVIVSAEVETKGERGGSVCSTHVVDCCCSAKAHPTSPRYNVPPGSGIRAAGKL
jgi:hypothetical protein